MMMKKSLFLWSIILQVILTCTVKAQPFSRLYYDSQWPLRFSSIEMRDGFSYLTGLTAAVDSPHYIKALWGKVDQPGDVIYMKRFVDTLPYSYTLYSNNLKHSADGNFLMCGEMIDTTGKIFISKIDTNGNIIFYASYKDTAMQIFQAQGVVEIPGAGYLIAVNASFITGGTKTIIIRTDTLGVIINKKIYGAGALEIPWVIQPMLNGHYMVGAISRKATTNTPFWCKTWMIEVDSMGNMVNQWLDSDATNMWPYGMQQTSDSGWIVVRQHLAYDVNSFQKYNAGIVKYSKTFNKEWEYYFGDSSDVTGFYDVEVLSDGKYIVCGTTPIWGSDSAHRFGWIVKFDTDGTLLWDKKYVAYERFGTHSFLYDIDILPNGDLLACGELRFSFDVGIRPIQQGWILRTDSNGCVIDNCTVGVEEVERKKIDFLLSPNPATTSVTINIDESMLGGTATISDIMGREIMKLAVQIRNPQFDIRNLSSGVYIVEVEGKGGRAVKRLVKQ